MRPSILAGLAVALAVLPALSAAAQTADAPTTANPPPDRLLTPEQEKRQDLLRGPAEQPLRDFNVVRSKIPPVLVRALADPYERAPADCDSLAGLVRGLDEALGPDLDAPVSTERPGAVTRGEATARDSALDLLSETVTEAIPFHGGVRLLTGADKHDRLVMAAITAGAERRAYLKGLGEARGCPPPAVPLHLAHPGDIARDASPAETK